MNLAGHEYEDRRLLEHVMKYMRSPTRHKQKRWVVVMETFGLGSTVARALCREFSLDPDDDLSK